MSLRIAEFEQGRKSAPYGDMLIRQLGEDLSRRFEWRFSLRNHAQMPAF